MRLLRRYVFGSAVFALCASGAAAATDPPEFYVGGAIGRGEVSASVANPFASPPPQGVVPRSDTFKERHSAFKIMVGLRPIPLLGAELSYLDLGSPTGSLFGRYLPASASMRGESAFGILYLPISVVDVFAKAGVARIQSTARGFAPNGMPDFICIAGTPCGTSAFQQDRTNTTFAAGAGMQLKIDAWAVRAEYERFNVAGEKPYLLSLGLTWSF